uniref:protein disulfide-isomerase n=1 Tax=Hemileia vastatrix TaxID=203904 RepID=T1UN00_9BASI|nr:disulfide isomerase [Hemileia vastatrix]
MRLQNAISSLLAMIALSSIAIHASVPDGDPSDDPVLTLTTHNFNEIIEKESLIMVEFSQSTRIPLSSTLKVFTDGKPSDYTGARTSQGISAHMRKRSLPAVSTVTSTNHTDFVHSDNVVVIVYLDISDTENLATFTKLAEDKRDQFLFGACYEHHVIPETQHIKTPSIILWKTFDERRNELSISGKLNEEELTNFVNANSVPLMDEITPSNFAFYSGAKLPLAYLFVEAMDPHRQVLIDSLSPIARQHKGRVNFVWIDASKFADHAKSLNLVQRTWPAFAIQKMDEQTKFPFDQSKPVEASAIEVFVRDFSEGKLKPNILSQPIPKSQKGPVFELVTDQWDEIINQSGNTKDIFIEFWAVIRFESPENDIPPGVDLQIDGFPTIKFKPAGKQEFVDYDGDRSLDSLLEFAEAQSANHVKAKKVEAKEDETVPPEQTVFGGHDEDEPHDEL